MNLNNREGIKSLVLRLLGVVLLFGGTVAAQPLTINLAMLDGTNITPDNMLNFHVYSPYAVPTAVNVKGTIHYRKSTLRCSYTFQTVLQQGLNVLSANTVHPKWDFSSSSLRELFLDHKLLPQGTYEYCVSISPAHPADGSDGTGDEQCLYRQAEDLFMINLVEPENNAKIYQYNPLLSWVVTYPLGSALNYRVRVAEIKEGQKPATAITRNNPVYEEKNIMQPSITYPVYAMPLKAFQPYAWTVDAYYNEILLGGAEMWKFTIIEDSLKETLPDESSYIDVNEDAGSNRYYAVGHLKLKYTESDFLQNELKIKLVKKGKENDKNQIAWSVSRGDNLSSHDLTNFRLKHKEEFEIVIEYANSRSGQNAQTIKFKYVNPDRVK